MKISKCTFWVHEHHGVVMVVDVEDAKFQALALAVDAVSGVSYHVLDTLCAATVRGATLRPATRLEILCHLRKAQTFIFRRVWDVVARHWETDDDEIADYTTAYWSIATGYRDAARVLVKEYGMDAEHDIEGGI